MTDAFDDFPTSSTLLVTVQDDSEAYQEGLDAIERLEAGDPVDGPDTFPSASVETLFETVNHGECLSRRVRSGSRRPGHRPHPHRGGWQMRGGLAV